MKNLYLLLLLLCNVAFGQTITCPNPVICGSNTSAVLSTSSSGSYQWSFSANEFGTYANISGATSNSHTTTTVGYYKVLVNAVLSPAYRVSTTPYGIIKNASGTTSAVNISAGQTTNLNIELYGQAPFIFQLYDIQDYRLVYSLTNNIVVPVTPPTSRGYNIGSINASCGSSGGSNALAVNVNPLPSFTVGTVASTVCSGGVLEIPITKTGTWDNNVSVQASLYNSSGTYFSAGYVFGLSGNTLKYQVPTSIANGSYRIALTPSLPFTNYSITYTPFFTVTNTSCPALLQASINSLESACTAIDLRPVPNGTGYTYKWFKDNNLIATTSDINSGYSATQSGSYHVVITNATTGYNSTSAAKSLTITGTKPLLTSPNPSICGTNTSTTISTTTTGAGYTYQWRKYNTTTFKDDYLVGETNSSLTVTSAGQYSIVLNDGACVNASNNYTISNTTSGVLTNAAGNNNAVNLAPGQTENLKLTLGGVGPWQYTLSDGVNFTVKTSSVAQVTLPVTPSVSTYYSVFSISSTGGCTGSTSNGNVVVNVSPNPVLSYTTPTMTTVCPGGIITIPYTLTGNVGTNRNLYVSLYTSSGTYINTGYISEQSSNPIYYQVPTTVAAGTYKFQIGANLPYISSIGFTPYTFDVVTTGCPAIPQASIQSYESACTNLSMKAVPSGLGYAFQWYKDNVLISGATSSNYSASLTGAYKVVVTNATTGYNSTSADKNITITGVKPILTSPNSSICGSNTSATISTTATGTYQWRKYNTVTFQNDILAGQTSSSITVTVAGQYSLIVDNGTCVTTSDNFTISTTTNGVLRNAAGNNNPVNLNPGQTENLQLTLGGVGPWTYTLNNGSNGVTTTTSTSPVTIPVSPEVSRNYYISGLTGGCGSGSVSGSVVVNVSPNPSFTFGTMATTACIGGLLEIPTIRNGNWGTSGTQIANLSLYTSAGTYVTYLNGSFSDANMLVYIPSNVVVGNSYKIQVSYQVPYIAVGSFSPNFTITNTCPPPPNATIQVQNGPCVFPTLTAVPSGAYTFQWKKDGVDIVGATNFTYSPKVSGNYSVNIQNSSISYNSTSSVSAVTVDAITPPISSPNPILCGTNTSATISTSLTGISYSYIWYKSSLSGGSATIIAGETNPTITVTEVGRYSVVVNNGTCSYYSNYQVISYGATGSLLNSNNTSDMVVLAPSQTENLKVNLTGTGPWEVGFNDGTKVKTYYTATSPLIIPVSPSSKTNYTLEFVSNACGVTSKSANTPNWFINVDVTPSIILTTPTPSNLTVCKGNFIDIPYTLSGTLGSSISIGTLLADAVGGGSRGVYTVKNFILEPPTASGNISLYIPYDVATGSYSILMGTNNTTYTFTNYAINVVTTGCAATPAPAIMGLSSACESIVLECSIYNGFSGSANTFQWYKNGVALTGKTQSQLTAYESGNYTVQVINTATSYNQTSAAKAITINRVIPTVTATNPVICGSNTTVALSTSFTGAGYTYKWYKDRSFGNGTIEQIPIFGETNSSVNVSQTGNYSVRVFDGSCLHNSKSAPIDVNGNLTTGTAFNISATPNANLTNVSGDNSAVTIAGGNSTQLRVTLTGGGPWTFDLIGSDGNTTTHTATTNPFNITISPTVNTNYSLANLTSSCGAGTVSGNLTVIVSPPPSFIISGTSAPNQSGDITNQSGDIKGINAGGTLCAGSTITVGYTTAGNWPSNAEITVELVNSSTNAVLAGTKQSGYNTNPILYFIPYNVPVGIYKVKLSSIKPYIETAVISSSSITLASTGCTAPDATIRAKTNCANSLLTAAPSGIGFTYQWYKNGTSITGAISSDYLAIEDGNYTVTVSNSSTGYTATSNAYSLSIEEINKVITSTGANCGSGGSVTFTSNNVGGSYTHQWYSSTDNVYFTPISGATNNTYTATTAGYYYVIIKTANCEQKSNVVNTCIATINFANKSVCQSSSVNVPFNFTGGENQQLTLQLIDATSSAIIISSLTTITSTINTNYNPVVSIPNSVTAGTYKFKVISNAPLNLSQIGSGVLTITGQTGGTAPTVMASVSSVSTVQNVTISAIGCVGDIVWNNSDAVAQTFPSFSSSVNKNTTYSAYCVESSSGCISPSSSTTVTYSCADAYEPNNTTAAATSIGTNTFTSPVICLNGFDNPDWFSWTNNGQTYYIKASLASSQVSAGNYKLKLSISGTDLIVETLPENTGEILDTYLTLFAADGVTVLSMNDNGNANGFSKLIYGGVSPCPNSILLSNTGIDDISSGVIIKEANATTGTITATNKITGTANVTYRAGKSITLNAGFKADNGVVFKTEFGGCN
jgi:hypothetical protein